MITNLTKHVTFYCMNHTEPVEMVMRERSDDSKDDFYACPKYMRKDEKHPDGHTDQERACANRLSFTDAGSVLFAFNKMVEDDGIDGMFADYTHARFSVGKFIDVEVLKHSGNKVRFGIYNRKAVEHS